MFLWASALYLFPKGMFLMTAPRRVRHDFFKGPADIPDPGYSATESERTITIDKQDGVCGVVTTGTGDARTLRRPTKSGVVGTVVLDTDGGDLTLTVTGGYNNDGDTAIVFPSAGNFVRFVSIKFGGAYYWRAIAQEGTDAKMENASIDALSIGLSVPNAAGSALSNAGELSPGINIVGEADNTKGCRLPASQPTSTLVLVRSTTASKSLPVYPPSGGQIDALGVNNAFTMPAGTLGPKCIFVNNGTGQWYTFPCANT